MFCMCTSCMNHTACELGEFAIKSTALQADRVAVEHPLGDWHEPALYDTAPPAAVSDDYEGVSKTFDIAATQDEWSAHLAACKAKPTDEAPAKCVTTGDP